jgi:CRISPR/Cas system-associated endonuclease Cas1
MQLLNALYVTLPDSHLRLDNDTLRLLVGDETRLRVPLHHLGAVVCFDPVSVSVPLMHRLADDGIALVLLDSSGRFKARLEGATSGNVLLRRAQHTTSQDEAFALSLARRIVAGKLRNQRHVLLRGARDTKDEGDRRSLARAAQKGTPRVCSGRVGTQPRARGAEPRCQPARTARGEHAGRRSRRRRRGGTRLLRGAEPPGPARSS